MKPWLAKAKTVLQATHEAARAKAKAIWNTEMGLAWEAIEASGEVKATFVEAAEKALEARTAEMRSVLEAIKETQVVMAATGIEAEQTTVNALKAMKRRWTGLIDESKLQAAATARKAMVRAGATALLTSRKVVLRQGAFIVARQSEETMLQAAQLAQQLEQSESEALADMNEARTEMKMALEAIKQA